MGILSKLEQRATLKNPPPWLRDGLGAAPTASGTRVNGDAALSSTAVLQAVRLISETLGAVPVGTYRRLDRGRELVRDHPVHQALQHPNPEITSIDLRSMVQGFVLTGGNGYAEIVRDRGGRVRELWPIAPHRVTPTRVDGALVYDVRTPDGRDVPIRTDSMLHIRGFSRGGLLGLDVINKMRETLGLTLATEEFGARFFGNGATLSGVLEHPSKLSEKAYERLKTSLEERHGGLSNAHRLAILEEGMEWKQRTVPPEAAQFLETRKFQIGEVSRMFNVTPHMLHDLDRATFNNIEELGISFLVYTMNPHYVRWEQAGAQRLFTRPERRDLFIKHNVNGLLRGNVEARGRLYNTMFNVGAYSPNDIRELEDQNPIEGGDTYFVPVNLVPLDVAAELGAGTGLDVGGDLPGADGADDDRAAEAARAKIEGRLEEIRERRSLTARIRLRSVYERLLLEVGEVIVNREVNAVGRLLDRAFGARDEVQFRQWIDEFYEEHVGFIRQRSLPVLSAYMDQVYAEIAGEVGGDPELPPAMDAFTRKYTEALADAEVGSSLGQLRQILRDVPPERTEQIIRERLDQWKKRRARKFARRNAVRTENALAWKSYKQQGVARMRWVTRGAEDCPLCEQLAGTIVGIDDRFVRKGQVVDPEDGETVPLQADRHYSHPPLHDGCDCGLSAA